MKPSRGGLILVLVVLLAGAVVTYGGFSVYADQHSGVSGKAKVTRCEKGFNTKYAHEATRCTGTWSVGGDPILGSGHIVVGRIEGADSGDVGKTIDVRLHGTDHATVPSITTPILLWAMGGPIALLGLFGLWHWWRAWRSLQSA